MSAPNVNYRAVATHLAATTPGLGPWFVRQIGQESGFDPNARSSAGAVGIEQVVPRYHPDAPPPSDPVGSLGWAARYMAGLVRQYHGDVAAALSVYNSGRPDAYKDPAFAKGQTYNYVRSILGSGGGQTVPTAPAAPMNRVSPPPAQNPVIAQVLASNDRLLGIAPLPALAALTGGATSVPAVPPTAGTQPPQPTFKRGKTIRFLEHFAGPFGLTVTSTTGGKHAKGSYHYRGRAVDFGGDPQRMAALAEAALQHPQDFVEFIYTGPGNPGYAILGGKVIPNAQLDRGLYSEHTNHVHLAA